MALIRPGLSIVEGQIRFCSDCSEIRPISDFGVDEHGRDGLKAHCRPCARRTVRKIRARRREALAQLKLKPCRDCAAEVPPELMRLYPLLDEDAYLYESELLTLSSDRFTAYVRVAVVVCPPCLKARRRGVLRHLR